jgi:hypothetical protein
MPDHDHVGQWVFRRLHACQWHFHWHFDLNGKHPFAKIENGIMRSGFLFHFVTECCDPSLQCND